MTKQQKFGWIAWHEETWLGWSTRRKEMEPEQRESLREMAAEAVRLQVFSRTMPKCDIEHSILELIQDLRLSRVRPKTETTVTGSPHRVTGDRRVHRKAVSE